MATYDEPNCFSVSQLGAVRVPGAWFATLYSGDSCNSTLLPLPHTRSASVAHIGAGKVGATITLANNPANRCFWRAGGGNFNSFRITRDSN